MLSRSKESSRASFSFVGLASNSSRASPAVSRSLFGGAGVRTGEGKEEAAGVRARVAKRKPRHVAGAAGAQAQEHALAQVCPRGAGAAATWSACGQPPA
jgi:hypothetical protein